MIALLAGIALLQGPSVVRGRVIDATTGQAVAEVTVLSGTIAARTDETGRFVITGLPPGEAALEARRLGYAPRRVVVTLTPGAPADIEIRLVPLPVLLEPVSAAGDRHGRVMRGDEARDRGPTLAEALDGWNGIAVVRRSAGSAAAPVVRGSAPHEVLVLIDGVPLNDPLTGNADLARIRTRDVAQVVLVPGAQTARYGERALAGVVLISTRPRAGGEGALWVGSHAAAGAEAAARLEPAPWTTALSLAWQRTADRYPVSLPSGRGGGEAIRENAGAVEVHGGARVEGPVEVSLRARWARRGLPGTLANPSSTASGSERWLSVVAWLGTARLGVEILGTEAEDTAPPTGLPYQSRVRAVGLDGALHRGAGGFGLVAGGRIDWLGGSGVGGQGATAARAHMVLSRRLTAAVSDWELVFLPTARLDVWNRAGSPALSWRADLTAARGTLSGYIGGGSSASHPVLADHLFHEGVGVRPNPDLRPERVPWEFDTGFRWHVARNPIGAAVEARGFVGEVRDLVLWAPDFRFIWRPDNFDVTRAGADLGVQLEFGRGRLTIDGALSATRVRYDRPGGPQVIYRPTHVASVRAAWSPGRWRAALAVRRLGTRYPNHGGTNPLAPVTVWDVHLGRTLSLRGLDVTAAAAVHDLTDRRLAFIAGQPLPGRALTVRIGVDRP